MKPRTMKILLVVQFVAIVLIVKWIIPDGNGGNNKTELFREISPKGDYILLIEELPNMFISPSTKRVEVTLYENNNRHEHYSATFDVDFFIGNRNADYGIEWLEDGVQIILSGVESRYYILPFKTLEDS